MSINILANVCWVCCLPCRLCEPCMLDPGCGFCYRENGSALLASSCVPVNKASTEHAAWGRWVTGCRGSMCACLGSSRGGWNILGIYCKYKIEYLFYSFSHISPWIEMWFQEWLKKTNKCVSFFQMFQLQPDERSNLLGLQLLSHLLLLAGFTGSGVLPGCFRSR